MCSSGPLLRLPWLSASNEDERGEGAVRTVANTHRLGQPRGGRAAAHFSNSTKGGTNVTRVCRMTSKPQMNANVPVKHLSACLGDLCVSYAVRPYDI